MAQSQGDRTARRVQEFSRHPRLRICLLKGCERPFHPPHPLSRYCSADCEAAARRWQRRRANRHYRASPHGKERRREQARRYRASIRAQRAANNAPLEGCEGYPYCPSGENSCCHRPGCYEDFPLTARSPRQKFCSLACRNALRRVLLRERRWRGKLARRGLARCQRDDFW